MHEISVWTKWYCSGHLMHDTLVQVLLVAFCPLRFFLCLIHSVQPKIKISFIFLSSVTNVLFWLIDFP